MQTPQGDAAQRVLQDYGSLSIQSVLAALDAAATAQSVASAYVISISGGLVSATPSGQNPLFVGTDAAAVLQAAITQLGSVGGKISFRNTGVAFPWSSVPGIPPGLTGRLIIDGGGSLISLSASGPRFLDFKRSADHDTFQNFSLSDFVVDATNSGAANMHTIIGSVTGTTIDRQRINFSELTIQRIRCFGVPLTGSRRGISLSSQQIAGGEGTQNYWKNILIEDVSVDGGQFGITVTGGPSPTITNLNMWYDNIRLIRCRHTQSSGTVVGAAGTAGCFQVGQNAPGGYVLLRDCFGEFGGDIGIEIDNAVKAEVENCVMSNCALGYLTTNFAAVLPSVATQLVTYKDCRAVVDSPLVLAGNSGWSINPNNGLAIGTVNYEGCSFFQNNNVLSTVSAPTPFKYNAATIRAHTIQNCKVNIESINWNNAANSQVIRMLLLGGCTIGLLTIKGLDIRVNGQISGAGNLLTRCFEVATSASFKMLIDGVDIDVNVAGMGATTASYGFFIVPTGASTIGGTIRRVRFVSLGSDSLSNGIRFGSTTNLTLTGVTIEGCDFTAMSGTTQINADATQTALGAIVTRSNRWKTPPAPVALTGLVTATGKTLGAAGAGVYWPAQVVLGQGSGAGITAVDMSTNGGTTFTNVLTQAAGALPAGYGAQMGPLLPADQVRVAFATTQPTVTLVPVDP